MGRFGVGQPVRRKEDQRLLTGHGSYTDDISLPEQTIGYVLRSPYAHAEIRGIDASAAVSAPGVLAVLTGEDAAADGLGLLPCPFEMDNRDGTPIVKPPRPVLAQGRVRHVGDPVAFIVAETLEQARDAAELVDVDYAELPAVTGTAAAAEAYAPRIWDQAPGNACFDFEAGDRAAADAGFARADHVTRLTLVNNRVAPAPLESRAAIGAYDPAADRYTLYTPSQGVHTIRSLLARPVLNISKSQLHVITGDVGGGFGLKIFLYPEQALAPWAAKRVGRPVKWSADRSEAFLGDIHGRDHVTEVALALDRDGRFLALKVSTIANLGAYLSNYGPYIPSSAGIAMLCGSYILPAVYAEVQGVFSNTCPLDAYRGAGRPEANYVIERVIDTAAHELGIVPAELRRRNFIPADALPYDTAMGLTYDSGDFARNMDDAMRATDWAGFEDRRAAAARHGLRRGIGMATYIEVCGGFPDEKATIRFAAGEKIELLIGNQSNGQGHETAYAQMLADRLGVDFDRIHVIQGDSDTVDYGSGTGGSRALSVGGSAVHGAAERLVEKGAEIAAHLLEAAAADIEFSDGRFVIAGTDRSLSIDEVAAAAHDPTKLPDGMAPGLEGAMLHEPAGNTYPNGCHVCEIEIDPDSGRLTIERYAVVDDFGIVVNPLLVEGQVHGGIAQGVGQALMELCVYDPDSGQLMTGSLMDYFMPRADDLPQIAFSYNEVPCLNNPLGVKGCGEAGAIGAPPAVINAVVDALAPLGVTTIDMPATPLRIWQTIQSAKQRTAA